MENIKETNKRAAEHAYQGSSGVNPIRGVVELTLSAEHLWENFKRLTMPWAGTASDYRSNCLQWLL